MKVFRFTILLILGCLCITSLNAQAINENFDDITSLPITDWVLQNNSNPIGSTDWFQGNPTVFNAQAGANNSYIGANFNNTTDANTISNWLITPERTFQNGDTVSFYTRTVSVPQFADRLQVRLSTAGASTNTGGTPTSVGDFTTLLLDIDPTYTPSDYPNVWTQYNLTISGLGGATNGRLAFRYFVEDGGPTGDNSDYIGIDTFVYTPAVIAAANAFVEGRVLNSSGRALNNTTVILTDLKGETRTVRTSSLGYYRFEDLPVGTNYIIRAVSKNYTFAPRLITLSESISEFDLTAESSE